MHSCAWYSQRQPHTGMPLPLTTSYSAYLLRRRSSRSLGSRSHAFLCMVLTAPAPYRYATASNHFLQCILTKAPQFTLSRQPLTCIPVHGTHSASPIPVCH